MSQSFQKKIGEATVKIVGDAGEGGRFYGAVTSKDIAEALKIPLKKLFEFKD